MIDYVLVRNGSDWLSSSEELTYSLLIIIIIESILKSFPIKPEYSVFKF